MKTKTAPTTRALDMDLIVLKRASKTTIRLGYSLITLSGTRVLIYLISVSVALTLGSTLTSVHTRSVVVADTTKRSIQLYLHSRYGMMYSH